jgi:hypothetical protein
MTILKMQKPGKKFMNRLYKESAQTTLKKRSRQRFKARPEKNGPYFTIPTNESETKEKAETKVKETEGETAQKKKSGREEEKEVVLEVKESKEAVIQTPEQNESAS